MADLPVWLLEGTNYLFLGGLGGLAAGRMLMLPNDLLVFTG